MLGPNIQPDAGHTNCSRCSRLNQPACSMCHRCNECCICTNCEECGSKHIYAACGNCNHCRRSGLCECTRRAGECSMNALISQSRRARLSLQPPRASTVELELADYKIPSQLGKRLPGFTCQVKYDRDGTIRGDNPVELILGPILGSHLKDVILKEWGHWRSVANPVVNSTCGMHVHVDAKHFDNFAMRRLLTLYRVMEPTFYSLVAASRKSNKNCKPISESRWSWYNRAWEWTSSGRIKEMLLFGTYEPDVLGLWGPEMEIQGVARILLKFGQRYAAHRGNNGVVPQRYCGLNVHSWFYRGTVEFRHHEGCENPQRIYSWMEWCRWFVELAQRLKDHEVQSIKRPEDFIEGKWERVYGTLELPQHIRTYIAAGRAPEIAVWEAAREPVKVPRPRLAEQFAPLFNEEMVENLRAQVAAVGNARQN